MVAEHELTDGPSKRHAVEDVGADARMNLDALELLGGQRIGLRQNVFGDGHVADVVQQRRGAHCLNVGVAEAGRLREGRGALLDRSNVLGCATGLCFDGEGERLDGC